MNKRLNKYMNNKLILASKSPRRQQLLKEAGFDFMVKTLDTEESYPETLAASNVAKFLAKKKAEGFIPILKDGETVITADTVVILNDEILGKPTNHAEARAMLEALSGQQHQVTTAVCIASRDKIVAFDDTTVVYFKQLSKEEIEYYIEKYQPFDKAGAYGIQEWIGMIGIQKIEGSYFTVMGLPMHLVYEALKSFWVRSNNQLPI